jgi:serine/threonine protein kinase
VGTLHAANALRLPFSLFLFFFSTSLPSSLSIPHISPQVWNLSWLAPEVMKKRQYTEKVDVYSFGIILWELYTRQMPFEEFKQLYQFDAQLEEEIKRGLRPSIPGDMPAMYV